MTCRHVLKYLLGFTMALQHVGCHAAAEPPYITETVGVGDIREIITATGDVSALVKVNVGSQVSGTIAKLHVDFNSHVKKGDLLAELDPRLFVAALARAEAQVAVAEAEVEKAKVGLMDAQRNQRRMAELWGKKMVAQADLDTADVAVAAAQAALKAAQATLLQANADRESAVTNLAFTKIRSPIDGVVIDRQVDVGQTVAAQFQVATLFTIANDLRHVQILANVDEADVGKVAAGMLATFSVDAYPGESFEGNIREVRQAPSSTTGTGTTNSQNTATSSSVVTYAAVVDANNIEGKLRQGMTAQVSVVIAERHQVLRVSNAALRFHPKSSGEGRRDPAVATTGSPTGKGSSVIGDIRSSESRVYRLATTGQLDPVSIKTGLNDGHYVEIVAGLQAGDTVVVGEPAASGGGGRMRRGLF